MSGNHLSHLWKVHAYDMYARVVDISEIEGVSTTRKTQNNENVNTHTKHFPCGIVLIMYRYTHNEINLLLCLSILNLSEG